MASKRALRRKMCEGKVRYTTIEEAEAVARWQSRMANETIVAYPCKFGRHFHTGHPKRSTLRKMGRYR